MTGGNPMRGKKALQQYGCVACHTIPGVRNADALVGPPLDHMGSRTYIGGVITNTPENMVKWLKNPHQVDPRTAMPAVGLSDRDARDIAGYLYTLK
jgi:cytochrome c1